MIDQIELLRLRGIFENDRTRVVAELPSNVTLSEVVGVSDCPESKTMKITISKKSHLYLCWVDTSHAMDLLLTMKNEIKKRDKWEDRWEAWELFGSTEPYTLQQRILQSRLKNETERKEFKKGYSA